MRVEPSFKVLKDHLKSLFPFRYGLKEFLVIAPAGDAEVIDNESKCHLLLSSVAIAATNTKW